MIGQPWCKGRIEKLEHVGDEKGTIGGNDGMGEKCKDRWRRHREEAFVWKIRGKQKEVNIECDFGAFETGTVGAAGKAGRVEFGSCPDGQNRKDEIVKPDLGFVMDKMCLLRNTVGKEPKVEMGTNQSAMDL